MRLRTIAINAAVILGTGILVPLVALAPKQGEQVAVVFMPWSDEASTARRIWNAGGNLLSVDGATAIARGDTDSFFMELRKNGAVLILNAERIAALCGSERLASIGY